MKKQENRTNRAIRPIGKTYKEFLARYLELFNVSLPEEAVNDLVTWSKTKFSGIESLSALELTLGVRPYIEMMLEAIDDTADRLAIHWQLPQDYLAYVLYGNEMKQHELLQTTHANQTLLALRSVEALHQALIKDTSLDFLLHFPAAQLFALPFELAGVQHALRLLTVAEPILAGLGIEVTADAFKERFEIVSEGTALTILRRGRELAASNKVNRRRNRQTLAWASDYEYLKLAIQATPTGNSDFDRYIHADARIMTDQSERLEQAQRTLDGMVQQAIALTPTLGIEIPVDAEADCL